ncbi:MAG TPA: M3 family metallopeptidase [Trebonia sp.]|jgi:oligoendopeptidase F|nr:M3 family metallopeptidase [Trebonia sp.]
MPGGEWLSLWPSFEPAPPPGYDFLARCADTVKMCESVAGRLGEGIFSRPAPEIARLLSDSAALRAAAAGLDGEQAASLAGDPASATLLDAQLAADAASDAMDEILQFIEREWIALADDAAAALLAEPALGPYRHYLASVRTLAPYQLAADAETALAARDPAAETAWVDLYHRVMAALRPVVDGAPMSMEEARGLLETDEPALRDRSLDAIYDAIEPVQEMLAHCLDTLIADRLAVNELRGLPYDRAERDLTNELPRKVVDEMLAAVEGHYHLAQRWFAAKAALLGNERPRFADMRAPIGSRPRVPYATATGLIAEAFAGFAPEAGQMVREMARHGRVDAEPRAGKQPGGFCWSLGPGQPPRIMLSYLGSTEDVVALAHELGHALHFTLAGRQQDGLSFDPPLALSEVAPAFAELLVLDWLIDHERDPDGRRLLAAKRADIVIEAVYSSTFLTSLEARAQAERAAGTVLTGQRAQQLWADCGAAFYGPAMACPSRWGLHWALVPHLIHERYYSYIYAFARLIGINLYADYRRDPGQVRERVLALLAGGSSMAPAAQLAATGIDISDPVTWDRGFEELARLLDPLC